ncbi:CHAT domain-containing protein [Vararia minispora EC-137]|uniref:CHAT domain-containing protein n=1 Tax=Vararia minispora EC-137 TaxID=1314806 RepID=A0ACB8QFA8_9AGAM|nr:CHAT domain-containing protein [Vararia minispora EC-137]
MSAEVAPPADISPSDFLSRHGVEHDTADNLGMAKQFQVLTEMFGARFEEYGNLEDIKNCIFSAKQALTLTPNDHPSLADRYNDLGRAFMIRFGCLEDGDLDDLNQGIPMLQQCVHITADDHPEKASRLNNLRLAFQIRFERKVQQHILDLDDLSHAISVCQRAVELTRDDEPDKVSRVGDLGIILLNRFKLTGTCDDLSRSIAAFQQTVDLVANNHTDKIAWLINLSGALQIRFERNGDVDDLSRAISATEAAVCLAPEGHPKQALCFSHLAGTSLAQFVRSGDSSDFSRAITAGHRAIQLIPDDGDPSKAACYSNLAAAFLAHFERVGEVEDLTQAISAGQSAVSLASNMHPDKVTYLTNLVLAFRHRFDYAGDLEDLSQAIAAGQLAIELFPSGHPSTPLCFINLSGAFYARFERLGDVDDLSQSIAAGQRAAGLITDDNPDKAICLNHLSAAFQAEFTRLRDPISLSQAVTTGQAAVKLAPEGHPNKALHLNTLSAAFLSRFKYGRDVDDLGQAVSTGQKSIELLPDNHPRRAAHLNNLGLALQDLFHHSGDIPALSQAISVGEQAVSLTPDGHPDRASHIFNLAQALSSRFVLTGHTSDLASAINYLRSASEDPVGVPRSRFRAASEWGRLCASNKDLPSPLPAFEQLVSLIPLVVTLGHPIEHRFIDVANEIGDAVNYAAAVASAEGRPDLALEWLEAGRGIVWSQFFQLRTPIDDLRSRHPEVAEKFEHLSRSLQSSPAGFGGTMPDDISTRLRFAREFETLLTDIRNLEGFEGFLLPQKYPQLIDALSRAQLDGPVVVINVHDLRCDAFAFSPSGIFRHIPLQQFTVERADAMRSLCKSLNMGRARHSNGDSDAPGTSTERGTLQFRSRMDKRARNLLGFLWYVVVYPILKAVEDLLWETTMERKPHIIWCPTGPLAFLPLHAAGLYGHGSQPKAFDFVASSYTPSLSALIYASSKPSDSRIIGTPSLLCVAQEKTASAPHLPPLSGTIEEMRVLKSRFSDRITCLEGARATTAEVLKATRQHTWIHLACHGTQDEEDPTDSAFLLHDGRLTLSDLIHESAAGGELAFLSACETAMGDSTIPDEAVHLAAGMLAVGYRGVVGTMWSIGDADAPLVADTFYATLLEDRSRGLVTGAQTGAAYALDSAVKKLQEDVGEDDFVRWVPFIHFGF